MTGLDVAARLALHEGTLYALARAERRSGVLFTDADGARRFASILTSAEGAVVSVEPVTRDGLSAYLRELALRDDDVMIDPEYVAGVGPVAATAPAYVARTVLERGLVAA